jgi:hypothetical protein
MCKLKAWYTLSGGTAGEALRMEGRMRMRMRAVRHPMPF